MLCCVALRCVALRCVVLCCVVLCCGQAGVIIRGIGCYDLARPTLFVNLKCCLKGWNFYSNFTILLFFRRLRKKLHCIFLQVEKQELNEFELLEEAAAANCSLSSNSSTVLRILGTKQVRRPADVNNNMLDARLKWNVIPKRKQAVNEIVLKEFRPRSNENES